MFKLFDPGEPPAKKRRRRLPDFLRDNEIDALIETAWKIWQETPDRCRKWKVARQRDWLMLQVGLFCGLRAEELCYQRIEDISLPDTQLTVRSGKGDADGSVRIPKRLLDPLRDWIGDKRSGWLFPGPHGPIDQRHLQTRLEFLGKRAGVPRHVHPHLLRHTYATQLLKRNRGKCDLRQIQACMRHRDVSTTMIYTHLIPEELQDVVDRL